MRLSSYFSFSLHHTLNTLIFIPDVDNLSCSVIYQEENVYIRRGICFFCLTPVLSLVIICVVFFCFACC